MGLHNLPDRLNQAHMPASTRIFYVPSLGHMFGWGTTVPADASTGWAKGALFVQTDAPSAATTLYQNNGTVLSSSFAPVAASLASQALASLAVSGAQLFTGGAAAAAVVARFGKTVTEGLEIRVIDEEVTFPSALAAKDLTEDVPSGAVILSVQGNLKTTVTATTAVKVGIGVAADPDKYGKTGALTKNSKIDTIPDWAVLSGAEDIQVYACATGGTAAGTLDSGTVRVRIVYAMTNSLDDAA